MRHLLFWGIAFASFHVSHLNTPAFCLLPYDGGQGPNFNFALFYDADKDQCNPFIYKGEGGNGNRFENERDCMRNCSANVENIYPMNEAAGKYVSIEYCRCNTPPSGERAGRLITNETVHACHFKKAEGQCNGKYLRHYYDSIHAKCKKFHWSGCVGNGNRFLSYESCNQTCAGIKDDGEDLEEEEPDTPIALICGLLLAVIIASIFITVIVLTVKSKKKSSKKTSGKSGDPKSSSPLQEPAIEMA